MEKSTTNCFTLTPAGTLSRSISVTTDRRFSRLNVQSGTVLTPLYESKPGEIPKIVGKHLYEAQPGTRHERDALVGKGDWQGAIVLVDSSKLDFSGVSSTSFGTQKLWPGAQGFIDPIAQSGKRHAKTQHQLIAVTEDDNGYWIVADHNSRCITIHCADDDISISRSTPRELAALLVHRARHEKLCQRGLQWTRHMLIDTLRMLAMWQPDLDKMLDRAMT